MGAAAVLETAAETPPTKDTVSIHLLGRRKPRQASNVIYIWEIGERYRLWVDILKKSTAKPCREMKVLANRISEPIAKNVHFQSIDRQHRHQSESRS